MLGKSVPLSALFQAPTIEQLASSLRQEGWSPPWSSLVVIQPQGAKPPFFCVHGHDGGAALAAHLGSDQPVYCLAPDLDGMESYTQIEDMASHYLKDVRALQPEGPYFLGGIRSEG
jgi:hypothetical protein